MGRGKSFTDIEKGQIIEFRRECFSLLGISCEICRSKNVVSGFLKDPKNDDKYHKSGRKSKLSPSSKRLLTREAKTGDLHRPN